MHDYSYSFLCNSTHVYSDYFNQNHVTCTYIDTTYKIFREKFNFYDLCDLKRAYKQSNVID